MMILPLKMLIKTSNLYGDLTKQKGDLKHQFFHHEQWDHLGLGHLENGILTIGNW